MSARIAGSVEALMPPPLLPAGAPVSSWRRLWLPMLKGMAVGAVIGVAVGVGWSQLKRADADVVQLLGDWAGAVSPGLVLVAALLSLWPHIVLHEAGHAFAGMATGMRPIAFGLGRWRWERGMSGWRFRYGDRLGGASGFASLVPGDKHGLRRIDQALYFAGGAAANLLTAAACAALLPSVASSTLPSSLLLGVSASALFIGLFNLVPFQVQGWRSDGLALRDLLTRHPDAALQMRLQQLMALSMAGVRPRDWPAELVPLAADATPHSKSPLLATSASMLRLSWAMDSDMPSEAFDDARRLVTDYPSAPAPFRPHIAVVMAGFAARCMGDPGLLAAWRPLCEGGLLDLSATRAWLDAELAAARGDQSACRAAIPVARQLLDRVPDPATRLLLGEYLDELEARVAAQTGTPGSSAPACIASRLERAAQRAVKDA